MTQRPNWRFFLTVVGIATFFGITGWWSVWLNDLAAERAGTMFKRLIEQVTGAWGILPGFFLYNYMVQRWPLGPGRWLRYFPRYVLAIILSGLVHTSFMWGSRVVLFPLLGQGAYNYGIMQYRFPMEFALQFPNGLVVIALLHAWYAYQRNREREVQTARLQNELAQARLGQLESQIEPHFLFNTLNAATSLMYSDPARADQMLGRLADLLRLMFRREEDGPEVPLSRELEWLGWYLEIMQLRFGERLTVRQEIDPAVLAVPVPRLILQPLVENALTHVVAKRAGPATIAISARSEAGQLRLTVTDDGPGVSDTAATLRNGVGLSNTAERLRVLHANQARLELLNLTPGLR
ncbi:MAG TPA: histidine kinase, partial [Gemmatimonadales bacterium]|nr:histidine kinase [Gemmatimonadales bacterium]